MKYLVLCDALYKKKNILEEYMKLINFKQSWIHWCYKNIKNTYTTGSRYCKVNLWEIYKKISKNDLISETELGNSIPFFEFRQCIKYSMTPPSSKTDAYENLSRWQCMAY